MSVEDGSWNKTGYLYWWWYRHSNRWRKGNDTECEKCNDNFYLYKENKKNCIVLDNIERYYKNGTSYYPCNESIENCEKCNDGENCYECNNNLKIILGEQNHCYNENILSTNNSLIKKNDTFYMKCSDNISHCETCELDNNKLKRISLVYLHTFY